MEREFYLQIIADEGFGKAVNDVTGALIRLKDGTESLIDEFMEVYEKQKIFTPLTP